MPPKLRVWLRRGQVLFSRRSGRLRIIFVGYLLLLAISSLSGDRGLLKSYRLWQECRRLDRDNAQLQSENRKLWREVELFRGDLRTIERYAREELRLAGENEIHYIFR